MATLDNLGRFKKPKRHGQTPFTDTTDRCERHGYTPSHKRIASLISAGLSLQVARDELWDLVSKSDPELTADLPPLPPIRRHLDTDLADLSQLSREYAYRKRVLEERLRSAWLEEREKPDAGVSQTPPQPEPLTPPAKPS